MVLSEGFLQRPPLFSVVSSSFGELLLYINSFHRLVQFSNRVSTAGKIRALLSGWVQTCSDRVQFTWRVTQTCWRTVSDSECVCRLIPVMLMTPVFIQGNISQCQANSSEPYRWESTTPHRYPDATLTTQSLTTPVQTSLFPFFVPPPGVCWCTPERCFVPQISCSQPQPADGCAPAASPSSSPPSYSHCSAS